MHKYILWDVDTQYDFMQPDGNLYVPDAEKLIPNIKNIISGAREKEIKILGSIDYHRDSDLELSDTPDFKNTFPPHCIADTMGAEKIIETVPVNPFWISCNPYPANELAAKTYQHSGEIYFKKQKFDVFTNPNVIPVLDIIKPHRIILFGVALDVCNAFAIEGFLKMQIPHIYLITDAVKAIDTKKGEQLTNLWVSKGIELKTSQEILEMIS